MTSRDFCYWLQGFMELAAAEGGANGLVLSPEQVACLRKHLELVFTNVTAPVPDLQRDYAQLCQATAGGMRLC